MTNDEVPNDQWNSEFRMTNQPDPIKGLGEARFRDGILVYRTTFIIGSFVIESFVIRHFLAGHFPRSATSGFSPEANGSVTARFSTID